MITSSSSPTFKAAAVTGQQISEPDLPGASQKANVDTHKTLGLDHPEADGAAAKPLDVYSVSHYDDLQQQKINSKKDLCGLVKDNIDPYFRSVPGCGRLNPLRFLHVMLSLCESSYQNAFPKTIIGVGSGQAFLDA